MTYHGQAPVGLAFTAGYDTIAVGLADFGVGMASMAETINQDNIGEFLDVVDTPGEATHLAVQDGYIFAADGFNGLAIIDANIPYDLGYVTNWTAAGLDNAVDIAVYDKYLAIADEENGVYFVDITQAEHPVYISSFQTIKPTSLNFSDDGLLLITSHEDGLTVIEFSY